jgi:ribonuclease HI
MPFSAVRLVRESPDKSLEPPVKIGWGQSQLYFDGGAKPNPGQMRCCVAIAKAPTEYVFRQLGHGSNNTAEWRGLLLAARIAVDRQFNNVVIYGDSMLIINQAKGMWRINVPEHRQFYREFCQLRDKIEQCFLHQVPRDHNLAGHYLEQH